MMNRIAAMPATVAVSLGRREGFRSCRESSLVSVEAVPALAADPALSGGTDVGAMNL
jgi:hypothetical protein